MSNKKFSVQASAQVPNLNPVTLDGSRFLVKPKWEGKAFRCFESGFHATCRDSIRVNRLENMRLGLEPSTPEAIFDLKGKQPLFYLQETFSDDHYGVDWNGLLLYALPGNKDLIRQIVLEYQMVLHVALAFDDPDRDLYFIVVDTELDKGTPEEFIKWQQDILDMQLVPLFHKPHAFPMGTYVRALTPDHYDIFEPDALFQEPVEFLESEGVSSRQTKSITQGLAQFFGQLFHKYNK